MGMSDCRAVVDVVEIEGRVDEDWLRCLDRNVMLPRLWMLLKGQELWVHREAAVDTNRFAWVLEGVASSPLGRLNLLLLVLFEV